ncbi:hypothetical protein C4K25_3074 [Pseudomonas chlororaphis]|nr:hypothetical protein C4K25_3074 [Pseudomonas chlororaphis]
MHSPAETHRLTLEYLQNTLLGVNALSAECMSRCPASS